MAEQEAATARTVGAVITAEREAANDLAAAERDPAADPPAIEKAANGAEKEPAAGAEAAPSLPPEMLPAEEVGTHPPGAPAKGDAGS